MKKQILVVEDDWRLAERLRRILQGNLEAQVTLALNFQEAHQALIARPFHLVLMDRGLPDGDGLRLVRHARNHLVKTHFLIISNQGRLNEREEGMLAGAVDYLAKPFSMVELKLKVKRILQESEYLHAEYLRLEDGLEFSPTKMQIIVDGQSRQLSKNDCKLLETLISNYGQIISYERLYEALGVTATELSTSALRVRMFRLRAKLGRFAKILHNLQRYGYCFNPTVRPKMVSKMT